MIGSLIEKIDLKKRGRFMNIFFYFSLKVLLLIAFSLPIKLLATSSSCRISQMALDAYLKKIKVQPHEPPLLVTQNEFFSKTSTREWKELSLKVTSSSEKLEIAISAPIGTFTNNERFPVLFVLGGFETGRKTIEFIDYTGKIILVGFQYPGASLAQIGDYQKALESMTKVPVQVASIIHWLTQQPWTRSDSIITLGVSLGAVYLPISQRVSISFKNIPLATIFAFGGGDFHLMFKESLKEFLDPQSLEILSSIIQPISYLFDPKTHLPCLPKSQYLTLSAVHDEVFLESSRRVFELLTPSKNTIISFDDPHIQPGRTEMIRQATKVIHNWLLEIGVISL